MRHPPSATSGAASYLAILAFLLLLAFVALRWQLPPWLLPAYGCMSLVSFLAYAKDKYAAIRGNWRTPEATLLLLALLGGWPGALLAQQWLRHKSRKRSFQLKLCLVVMLNLALLLLATTPLSVYLLDR